MSKKMADTELMTGHTPLARTSQEIYFDAVLKVTILNWIISLVLSFQARFYELILVSWIVLLLSSVSGHFFFRYWRHAPAQDDLACFPVKVVISVSGILIYLLVGRFWQSTPVPFPHVEYLFGVPFICSMVLLFDSVSKFRRYAHRRDNGLCQTCGYDLNGCSSATSNCPECGATV